MMVGDPKFYNCIIKGNEAPYGAGIGVGGWADAYVYNSIIFDDFAADAEGAPHTYYSLFSPDVPNPSWYSWDYIVGDPLFIDSENGNFHLETKGDTNFDTNIDVLDDVVLCVGIINGEFEGYNAQLWAADFNTDGVINVLDVILIVNVILN